MPAVAFASRQSDFRKEKYFYSYMFSLFLIYAGVTLESTRLRLDYDVVPRGI